MREALMAFVTEEARTTSFPLLASPEDEGEREMGGIYTWRGVLFPEAVAYFLWPLRDTPFGPICRTALWYVVPLMRNIK